MTSGSELAVQQPVSDVRTRDRLTEILWEHGPATASTLAERLEISPAGVRRHLDALVAQETVTSRPARPHGRGRPARVFALTESGHRRFAGSSEDLASSALRFLAETAGPSAVGDFARRRAEEVESRYRPAADVTALAAALSADGYAATVTPGGAGVQLCQHHCPVAHVAAEFPQICDAETEVFARLLGTHVQRLATLAHGDGVCTTHVPAPAPARSEGRTRS